MALERLPTVQMLVLLFFSFLVTNSDTDKLRLRGGETPCSGRVEIRHSGSWGTVCSYLWDLADAHVVCQQLGCGSALDVVGEAAFGPGKGTIWLAGVKCTGKESFLWDCPAISWESRYCTHEQDAGVRCSGFVQLVAGNGPCVGRVEVNSGTKQGTVCDWNFTFSTAKVICTELQCGTAVFIMKRAPFGKGNGYIWDTEFQCNGNEPLLSLCPTVPFPQGKCSHSMDVGVICSRYTAFCLMNGSSQCEGRVEIQVFGTWRTLCDSHWDLADANILCHQLNCGVAMNPPEDVYFGKGNVPTIGDTFYCTGTESHLRNCSMVILGTSPYSKGKIASVICSGNQTQSLIFNNSQSDQEKVPVLFSENGQLRLLNGRGPCSGRVEVYYNGTWGTICDDSWDLSDAQVVCRQLGCGVALKAMVSAHFGQRSGPIWLDELSCSGNESHLGEWPSLRWGQHDCRHKENAGVLCSESLDLRLGSEDHKCSGWLEVFYNGTWGSVCSNAMDYNTVSVICRHLKCGTKGNIETFSSPRESWKARWIDKINRQGQESFLWHCPSQSWHQNSCHQGEEALITCEGEKLPSTTKGPKTSLNSLLGILCLILGVLLLLVLILLGIQIHRGRVQQKDGKECGYGDSLYEAVYQEIDYYMTGDKEDFLSSPDISSQPDDTPGDGYDDVEELSGPEIFPVTQMNEGDTLGPTNEWDEYSASHTGQSPEFFGGSSESRLGEDDPPMSSEDLGYDEAEIGVPQMSL